VAASQLTDLRAGRLLTSAEKAARAADEAAFATGNEVLRSAFAISAQHVLTAWHCVRDVTQEPALLWFRAREKPGIPSYAYIPVRLSNYDETFDVAALAIDWHRLGEANLTQAQTTAFLSEVSIPLSTGVTLHEQLQVMGFPESASGADGDTNWASVVDTKLPLGAATGLKLYGSAFAAVSPVDPHGLSGGPVLRAGTGGDSRAAVAVIRAAPTSSMAGAASGGGLIATRIQDVAGRLPEIAVALAGAAPAASAQAHAGASPGRNALDLLHACWERLRDSMIETDDPDLGHLIGWPHFFDEPAENRRPTGISTAYGLKLVLALGVHDNRPDRSGLAETLWKLRHADGGWSARTGKGLSRPEVSALVVSALSTVGFSSAHIAEAAAALESACAADRDPVTTERTYVASAAMRGLVSCGSRLPRLAQLRAVLLAGAIRDPERDNLPCWSIKLRSGTGETLLPSAPHTAMAIVALQRTRGLLGEDAASRAAEQQAARWLRICGDLANQTEQIRRFIPNGDWDTITIRHFTAAWVARALLLTPPDDSDALLENAMRQVWRACRDGLWEWDDGEHPVWMSYQGASVTRDYALRSFRMRP
jgi:hypothetical protein